MMEDDFRDARLRDPAGGRVRAGSTRVGETASVMGASVIRPAAGCGRAPRESGRRLRDARKKPLGDPSLIVIWAYEAPRGL